MPKHIKAWGLNTSGQLGLGHSNSPVAIPTSLIFDFGIENSLTSNTSSNVIKGKIVFITSTVLQCFIDSRVRPFRTINGFTGFVGLSMNYFIGYCEEEPE